LTVGRKHKAALGLGRLSTSISPKIARVRE
jgi:hypothetical protein